MSLNPGQVSVVPADIIAVAEEALRARPGWTAPQRQGAARVAAELVRRIPMPPPCAVGLAGAPGSGKSVLAGLIHSVMASLGTDVIVLSLDDYYLGRTERAELSLTHPLFTQRGVAGTHDWDGLIAHLDLVRSGQAGEFRLPRFDKSRDDRCVEPEIVYLDGRPRVVILEGWLVGAPAQAGDELSQPVNMMEMEQDSDGRWRALVNRSLARYHDDLAHRLDCRWFLAAPNWQSVIDWRWQQERDLERSEDRSHLDGRVAIEAFLDQFQRISQHMLDTCNQWADVIVRIDEAHVMNID